MISAATIVWGRQGRDDRDRRSARRVARAAARPRIIEVLSSRTTIDLAPGSRLRLVDLGIPPPKA